MTDEEVMAHPAVKKAVEAIEAADRALEAASKATGRSLMVFCGSGCPAIIDADRDEQILSRRRPGPRGCPLVEGGSIVASTTGRNWEGGDF